MKAYHGGKIEVYAGDCLEVMAGMDPDLFDGVVTDPPYELGFMGRKWDATQISHKPETWAAVLRVLKPGAHLVAFGAPKNWHRLVCAIEDAGFEIRDNLLWLFGSGFPKSHDVSKAIDRELGAEREIIGDGPFANRKPNGSAGVNSVGLSSTSGALITAPATDLGRQWQGWGTALKPAYEPIVLARKPLIGTVAANVMTHGTGALNIDACRVEIDEDLPNRKTPGRASDGVTFKLGEHPGGNHPQSARHNVAGRWPANVIHDGSTEVVAGFPENESSDQIRVNRAKTQFGFGDGKEEGRLSGGFNDSGSAARFFYTAKADSDDRIGSKHPTVKPLDLIQWLCRLITPPRGHILDPFAGTGTTAEAAMREGFRCTLIEREAEFLTDIERRMALVFEGDVGRNVAMAKLKPEPEPLPLFAPVWQRIMERHDDKPWGIEEAHQNGVGCYEDWMAEKRRGLE